MTREGLVEIVAAEARVSRGRLDLDHALHDLEHRHVERAAAEVEHDGAHLAVPLVQAIRHRRGGRFVDDAFDGEPRDGARVSRRLALQVAEVGGHRHDRLVDGDAQGSLRIALERLEHEGRQLLRPELPEAEVEHPIGAHVALEGERGPRRMRRRARACGGADQDRAVVGRADGARRQRLSERVG
jgi:hypothetical protein